jgi:hypothetical protein
LIPSPIDWPHFFLLNGHAARSVAQALPTAVDFGKAVGTNVTVVSATTITAQSPAGTGTVDVTLSAFGETSATSAADVFTYTADGSQVTSVARYPSLLD